MRPLSSPRVNALKLYQTVYSLKTRRRSFHTFTWPLFLNDATVYTAVVFTHTVHVHVLVHVAFSLTQPYINIQYASKITSHKRPVQRAPVLIKRGLNGARTTRERERPFDCPFERARVSGRQCRRPAPLLRFFRTWSAKTSLDYHVEARIPVP